MVREADKKAFYIMANENTRRIVVDYIFYRLDSCGYIWENGRQGGIVPNEVQRAMRSLGDEFEERFRDRFDNMIDKLDLTEANAGSTFTEIAAETFADNVVNWGRVVALFGFAGRLAVHCYEKNLNHNMVDNIVDWVTAYVDINLRNWMETHNRWQGFLDFHAGGPEARRNNPWPTFKTICGYAAAGLGVLTLGAFLTQKS
ncbi:Apoptosis regulator bcl-2 [Plakobranchus ocellatus]|uniref:Apoptosis regulator bcl-2 n=1 Tax=Plakobranchus ocellatus TaxID=259542 RepID=A0AAV4AUE8_9GAST|nr:Apoptosis regulator bcl-2 [Plakobranchus ocellatus]